MPGVQAGWMSRCDRNPPGHSCISHSILNPILCTHYPSHHQPSHTTASLLGIVYSQRRCQSKTPALSKRNESWREGGSAAQG